MEKQIITFSANEQCLQKTGGVDCYASNTVAYIEAHFDLGTNWSGFDSVRAVWFTDFVGGISTVLDSQGVCVVPFEVLTRKSEVKVNLVGSIADGDVLTDRLTTCPVVALTIKCNAKVDGDNEQPITPSQFEQFVAQVISEVEKVTGMTAEAETLPSGSQATARYENGKLYIGIPQGEQGEQGESGVGIASVTLNADYTLTITMTDGTSITTTSIRGERGEKGETGADGITPSISIGNVETLEPDEDAYVTRRGTDAEPIFDFGIPKGDKGEDAVIPWDSILPVDTASGAIASFPDGTDLVPAKSLKVALEPIQSGSGTPSPDNVRPISGRTEVVTHNTALAADVVIGGIYDNGSGESTQNTRVKTDFIAVSEVNVVDLIGKDSDVLRGIHFYDANKTWLSADSSTTGFSLPFTNNNTPNNTAYVRLAFQHSDNTQVESAEGKRAVLNWSTYTTSLGQTVYGGTLDVVSGELVVDRAMVDLGDLSWSYWNGLFYADVVGKAYLNNESDVLSDKYESYPTNFTNASTANTNMSDFQIAGFRSASGTDTKSFVYLKDSRYTTASALKEGISGTQLCYERATPQTIQLTPQQVQLLLGNNNVWSDGNVTLVYSADIQKWVEKKLNGNSTTSTLTMSRPTVEPLKSVDTVDTSDTVKSVDTEQVGDDL